MMDMNDDDQKLKDALLQSLIEKMEDVLGDDMNPHKGMAVEVAAPDKEHLADGLDKAKEVLDHAPMPGMDGKSSEEADDGKSDEERLAELLGDSEDKDDEDDEDNLKK